MTSAAAATIEITVLSAQGLRNASSFPFFWKRHLRSYATVALSELADESCQAYSTRTDDLGGTEPQWDEKFRIPVDSDLVSDVWRLSICVRVYAKGGSQLGWCRVPVEDVAMSSPGRISYLSYRLKDPRDGTRGHGIVNVAVKLDGLLENAGCSRLTSFSLRHAVIGIPVSLPIPTGKINPRRHHYKAIW